MSGNVGGVTLYEMQVALHASTRIDYDTSDPDKLEKALSRGAELRIDPVGGLYVSLVKPGGMYVVKVIRLRAQPRSEEMRYETLESALNQVEELVKLAEELES